VDYRLRQKLFLILKATRQHARNLGLFALLYKATLLLLSSSRSSASRPATPTSSSSSPTTSSLSTHATIPASTTASADPFLAGLLSGYLVFGRSRSSVSQQIVTYVFARVALGLAKLAVQPRSEGGWELIRDEGIREGVREKAWPVFASVSWGVVMWLFWWHPEVVQPSMRSSMNYIYLDSDKWDSLKTFLWHNK